MTECLKHPFTVSIFATRPNANRFSWSIRMRRGKREPSAASYGSFEEARVAAKSRLDVLIAAWMLSNKLAAV